MFHDNMKAARLKLGQKKTEVARKLEIPYTTYNGYETGQRKPTPDMVAKIATALDVDVNTLLYGEGGAHLSKMLEEQRKRDEEAAAPATQLSTDQLQKRVHTKVDNLTNKGLEKVDGYIDGLSEEEGYKLHWVEEGDK